MYRYVWICISSNDLHLTLLTENVTVILMGNRNAVYVYIPLFLLLLPQLRSYSCAGCCPEGAQTIRFTGIK